MAADDPTVQTVTINKDLTLELDGYDLPDTRIVAGGGAYVTLNDRLGTGEIGKLSSVEDNTLSIYDATVVINNLRVYGYKSDEYTGSVPTEWGESAIYLYEAGTLTINGGSYFGRGNLGDGIRVREGATLTINGGLFQALVMASPSPTDTMGLRILPSTRVPFMPPRPQVRSTHRRLVTLRTFQLWKLTSCRRRSATIS